MGFEHRTVAITNVIQLMCVVGFDIAEDPWRPVVNQSTNRLKRNSSSDSNKDESCLRTAEVFAVPPVFE